MADGFARATGRVGVAMATSGPGATNLVTGIATAMMDGSPIVCITGQVSSSLLGLDAFQEVDITGITMPITKHNFLVTDAAAVAPAIVEAFAIAASGRPGPVLVDITKDAQQGRCAVDWDACVAGQAPRRGAVDRRGRLRRGRRTDRRRQATRHPGRPWSDRVGRVARCCGHSRSAPRFRSPRRCSASGPCRPRTR